MCLFFLLVFNGEEISLLVFPIENKRMSFDSALLFLKIETLITKQVARIVHVRWKINMYVYLVELFFASVL